MNRALEELEKYKLALKDAKMTESAKNEGIRRDLDKLTDENRRLEKQRKTTRKLELNRRPSPNSGNRPELELRGNINKKYKK